ncbi:sensor histidine kinase [Microbacterium sp. ASV49]|uniref:histidine kinase n=1 Tax=Microbacterium candidum TaxID=3041922 RepID=A0ABT7MVS2_9MICO|nr:HAMP domain-containing sensor histidine kinase [Microbacterium sp. ASV49]MDL9978565.1 HAMP domain-containing sensor histidine kinase [Microbacterium sp. ASV49]
MRTLSARTLLATTIVAIVAVVATAAASLPLVSLAVDLQVRRELTTQATTLAAASPAVRDRAVAASGPGGTRLAVVSPDGTLRGPAKALVPPRLQARLDVPISTTVDAGGKQFVVVSRPIAGGGAVVAAQRVDDVQQTSRAIVLSVLGALLIGLLVAIGVGALLARATARPLRATAALARRIAAGERGIDIPPQPITEVDDVASALTTLDRALASSEARQREFLLSVSHELRTPLTAVRGYAEALADGMIEPDEMASVGSTLVAETTRLDSFVSDLLELARLEADDFTVSPTDVDAATLVADAGLAWSGRARGMQVSLVAQPGAPALLHTDPMRARQLLDGLIENALRAVPAGGNVIVARPDARSIEVRDDGPGLTADDLAHVFDRGVLHDRYRATRPVGTGLGLSIAVRLATRLGARLEAGRAPEGGASFRVTFPAP